MTNVMDVTTSMAPVIKGVNQAGRDTIVNNVMYQLKYSLDDNFKGFFL